MTTRDKAEKAIKKRPVTPAHVDVYISTLGLKCGMCGGRLSSTDGFCTIAAAEWGEIGAEVEIKRHGLVVPVVCMSCRSVAFFDAHHIADWTAARRDAGYGEPVSWGDGMMLQSFNPKEPS